MRLELFSEPFAKTGNIASDGLKRLLGCPAQDLLQTVLRESIQNSIDAALPETGPSLLIRLRTLTPEQCSVLREYALTELPQENHSRNKIAASIEKPNLKVLEICDFGSTGLSGPTTGDIVTDGKEPLNFVNFLRNVGVARDTLQGGGTYGYGKASLYAMSACSTIFVDSQTTWDGNPVRRFMGCHLGSAFDADTAGNKRRRFTGRHWWGISDGEGGTDPSTGTHAAAIAASLGMPQRGLYNTGTSVLILDPYIEEGEEARAPRHYIQETILWNFWPRLIASTPPDKKLTIRVEIEGVEMILPPPEEFPPLDLFASAMKAYRDRTTDVKTISSERPKKDLGKLAIKKGLRADRFDCALDQNSLIPRQTHHIALMRPVELIVKYVEGIPFADARFEWAGVFVCSDDDEVESAFAMSEPPAHDDWIPDNLSDRNAKTYVRVALKRIEKAAGTFAEPVMSIASGSKERRPSLAGTANRLGRLLDSVSGTGPGRPKPTPRPPFVKQERTISPARFIRLQIDDRSRRCAIFEAEVQNDEMDAGLEVLAEPHLIVDGAIANGADLPTGFETGVIQISFDVTGEVNSGSTIKVGTESGTIYISILSPPEAAVGVRLRFLNRRNE